MAKAEKSKGKKGKGKGKGKGKKEELEIEEEKKGGSTKIIIIVATALLCVGLGAIGTYFMMGGGGSEEASAEQQDSAEKQTQAIYYQLPKPFIVSFQSKGKQRYMQVKVAFKSRDQIAIDTIKMHLPVVKNNLNQVFGSKQLEELQTFEGLQQLNQEATEAVQAFLEKEIGAAGIEQVLFTNFVMQ